MSFEDWNDANFFFLLFFKYLIYVSLPWKIMINAAFYGFLFLLLFFIMFGSVHVISNLLFPSKFLIPY